MSSQTLPRPRKAAPKKKRKATATSGPIWWPLIVAAVITVATVKTAEILPLMGADGLLKLKLLYPFALLLKEPLLGLSDQTSDSWSQIMLYAQYPIYGLYITVATNWKPVWKLLLHIAAFHLLGFAVLWILART